MDMKQRIIGLVVLLAFGIILVPLLFDSETVIKPTPKLATRAPKPVPKMSVATAAIPSAIPKKNFTPAPSIIEPGAIEASAEKMLEHQHQTNTFVLNEPQDVEEHEEEDSEHADLREQIAQEEKSAPVSQKPVETIRPSLPERKLVVQEKQIFTSHTQQGNWVIQLGSFSEVSNANKLVAELKSKGFTAFTEQDHKNKNRHRVLIGPEEDRTLADKTVAKLEKQFHIKSIVVRVQR